MDLCFTGHVDLLDIVVSFVSRMLGSAWYLETETIGSVRIIGGD